MKLRDNIELVKGASHVFDKEEFLRGELTPVFFGSAINNFGVRELLDAFAEYAPAPQARETLTRAVDADGRIIFPVLFLKSRLIWIQRIATELLFYACVPAVTNKA